MAGSEIRLRDMASFARRMIYIVRRTQLYLDGDLWKTLHMQKYLGAGSRRDAMRSFAGIRKGRRDLPDTEVCLGLAAQGRQA